MPLVGWLNGIFWLYGSLEDLKCLIKNPLQIYSTSQGWPEQPSCSRWTQGQVAIPLLSCPQVSSLPWSFMVIGRRALTVARVEISNAVLVSYMRFICSAGSVCYVRGTQRINLQSWSSQKSTTLCCYRSIFLSGTHVPLGSTLQQIMFSRIVEICG